MVYPKDQEMRMYCMRDLCATTLMMAHLSSNIIMNKIQLSMLRRCPCPTVQAKVRCTTWWCPWRVFSSAFAVKKLTGGTFCSWLQRTNRISFQASKLLVPSHCIWARHFLICRKVSSSISLSLFWWASRFFCAWQNNRILTKWRKWSLGTIIPRLATWCQQCQLFKFWESEGENHKNMQRVQLSVCLHCDVTGPNYCTSNLLKQHFQDVLYLPRALPNHPKSERKTCLFTPAQRRQACG